MGERNFPKSCCLRASVSLVSLKSSQLSRRIRVEMLASQFKFRAFPNRVSLLRSKTAMVGCCKLSLYANESCDKHAIYFRR